MSGLHLGVGLDDVFEPVVLVNRTRCARGRGRCIEIVLKDLLREVAGVTADAEGPVGGLEHFGHRAEGGIRRGIICGVRSIGDLRTDGEQGATFVELFFDLVFVFAVTQVVSLVHHDLTWDGVLHGLLVFWLIWWAWTQFTWALNGADTELGLVQLATLVAAAAAFFMALGVPDAYADGQGLWFVIPYVAVRVLGLSLYLAISWRDSAQRSAVWLFTVLSTGGLVLAVVGGVVDGPARAWFWL